jgi:predicted RNA-binding protein YlxR (DUF448 family)
LRLVADAEPGAGTGAIVPDAAARRPGRGVYVHARRACVDRATRGVALARALRLKDPAPAVLGAVRAALTDFLASEQSVRSEPPRGELVRTEVRR